MGIHDSALAERRAREQLEIPDRCIEQVAAYDHNAILALNAGIVGAAQSRLQDPDGGRDRRGDLLVLGECVELGFSRRSRSAAAFHALMVRSGATLGTGAPTMRLCLRSTMGER